MSTRKPVLSLQINTEGFATMSYTGPNIPKTMPEELFDAPNGISFTTYGVDYREYIDLYPSRIEFGCLGPRDSGVPMGPSDLAEITEAMSWFNKEGYKKLLAYIEGEPK